MRIIYNEKSIILKECKSFFSRFKGFMGAKKIDCALLFDNCNSIHTFFMKSNIDVIMCDKNNKVIYYYNNLGKNKIILPKKNVYKVIELPVDFFNIELNKEVRIEK